MSDLFEELSRMPFAPIVGWTAGHDGRWIGIGLGDLLLMTVFPPVMRKAFGRGAGRAALAIGGFLLVGILALSLMGNIRIFPVMAVLGPAMALQYSWWARHMRQERTTREYLAAEPR
jgi:hypothetical protein